MLGRDWWFVLTLSLISLTACGTPAPAPTPVPAVIVRTPGNLVTATSQAAAAGAQVPGSCNALESLVGAYTGGVATTKMLGAPPHLSCEFANANASTIVVLNIGTGGTAASFDALRATSAQGGRTVAAISGLGAAAFSVSKNGVPGGVSVLSAQGLVYVVESNLPLAQDQALIEQLMQLP